MNPFDNMSQQGRELAFSTLAFRCMVAATQKISAEVAKERKAAEANDPDVQNSNFLPGEVQPRDDEPTIDARNRLDGADRGTTELEGHPDYDTGTERRATLDEYLAVAVFANDQLETMANGGKWPRPQDPKRTIEWLATQETGYVTDDNVKETIALVQADTGHILPYDDAKMLAQEDADRSAKFFAERIRENFADIHSRLEDAISNVSGYDSFETAFGRLPASNQHSLLVQIERKIDTKCAELRDGKNRRGVTLPVARIPKLARAGMIAELRADQKNLQAFIETKAHAADPITA